jgi:threonine dehydrogenase-like Zn-dependent dehydrogenase
MNFQGVLCHEFVGVVERAPEGSLEGARVVGEINVGCGHCSFCLKGMPRHCFNRTVLGISGRNGAMAEYLTLPAANLLRVPAGLTDEQAVFTEPLAAAMEILEQVKIQPAHRVLVIGDGKLGLLISMVLRLTGCDLLTVGKHVEKLDLIARPGGSVMLLDDFSGHDGLYDVVVEASGHPSGWDLAVSRTVPRGVIVLKSTYHGSLNFNTAPLVINEVTVIGSRCGLFGPALRIMERRLVDPSPLVSEIFPLERAEEAFLRAMDRNAMKVLLRP